MLTKTGHSLTHHARVEAECTTDGNIEYWACSECGKNYSDANGTTEVASIVLSRTGHSLTHHARIEAECTTDGNIEYWSCSECEENFSDENGENAANSILIPAGHDASGNSCTRCGQTLFEGMVFTLNNGEYSLTGYTGNATDIIIPATYEGVYVTAIDWQAFSNCTTVKSIYISASVKNVHEQAFDGCVLLESIVVAENNGNYSSVDGNLYNKDKTVLIRYAVGKADTSFDIPSTVVTIGRNSFANASKLKSINIPSSVSAIEEWAFMRCTAFEQIVIPVGVTTINNYTFSSCASLKSVTIPNSVTRIKFAAFSDCTSLDEITIPSSVTELGNFAFSGCSSIESIIIPESVTSLGEGAFHNCTHLTNITIKSTVTSLGAGVFAGCASLENIDVDANNSVYKSIDGNVYTIDGRVLIQYAVGKPDSAFLIPATVTSIGDKAFCGSTYLESISIPEGVKSIGAYAFAGCSALETVTFSSSVSSIGGFAFNSCTALETVKIPATVTQIDGWAFANCHNLTIYCEADSLPLTWESDWNVSNRPVYWGACIHTKVYYQSVAATCTTDGNIEYWACSECGNNYSDANGVNVLNSVVVPASHDLTHYDRVESTCTTDGTIEYWSCSECFENFADDGGKNKVTDLVIPAGHDASGDSCTRCGQTLFEGMVFTLNNGEYSVTDYTGDGTDIVIPATYEGVYVTEIGSGAFDFCDSIKSVTMPSSIKYIGSSTFSYCAHLETVSIPESVVTILNSFDNCTSLISISVDENNAYYKSIDGNLYTKDTTVLKQYALAKNDAEFIIPDGVTSISQRAFMGARFIESVVIPSSVVAIRAEAFYKCTSLKSVTFEENSRCAEIGISAFCNCSSMESINIPSSVISIEESAFYYCSSLASISVDADNIAYKDIDGNLYTKDGTTLIQYAPGKTDSSFVISDTVTSLGAFAFYDCSSLTSVTIGNGITALPDWSFFGCTSLTNITIGNGVTSIGSYTFYRCDSLTSINYRGTESEWNDIIKGDNWDYETGSYTITFDYTGE